jgi:hypothetical protein
MTTSHRFGNTQTQQTIRELFIEFNERLDGLLQNGADKTVCEKHLKVAYEHATLCAKEPKPETGTEYASTEAAATRFKKRVDALLGQDYKPLSSDHITDETWTIVWSNGTSMVVTNEEYNALIKQYLPEV